LHAPALSAETPGRTREYDLKAAFLFNFAQFVVWPPDSSDSGTPFVIGVIGEDPFGGSLDAMVEGETVHGRPIATRRGIDIDDARACQVLFVSRAQSARLDAIFSALKGASVLTVSDAEDFAARGGIIGFSTQDKKLRLQINAAAAEMARLSISSKLLRQAEIVETVP
jgi:hypothetical protein